jgi:hypothetical protein
MRAPVLAVGDGALGFWAAMREVFPETREQRCWFHAQANVLAALPKSAQPGAKAALAEIYNAEDREHALAAVKVFAADYGAKCPKAVAKITDKELIKSRVTRRSTGFDDSSQTCGLRLNVRPYRKPRHHRRGSESQRRLVVEDTGLETRRHIGQPVVLEVGDLLGIPLSLIAILQEKRVPAAGARPVHCAVSARELRVLIHAWWSPLTVSSSRTGCVQYPQSHRGSQGPRVRAWDRGFTAGFLPCTTSSAPPRERCGLPDSHGDDGQHQAC